jgi:hypothetical protein
LKNGKFMMKMPSKAKPRIASIVKMRSLGSVGRASLMGTSLVDVAKVDPSLASALF